MSDIIRISELPLDIQKKLPLTLRTYKSEYELEELPFDIQELIEQYRINVRTVSYDYVLDCMPRISKYGDFEVISNLHTLVLEYLKNYLLTLPGDYPFDPSFGCKLKLYLHKLDTNVQYTLIENEVRNIVNSVASDLNIDISFKELSIQRTGASGVEVDYNILIKILINNIEKGVNINIVN